MMERHGLEKGAQGSNSNRCVIGHSDMMLAILLCAEPDMGTVLTNALVTEFLERLDELLPVDVARGLHAARTSSRTKWSRMTLGMRPGTPSPK